MIAMWCFILPYMVRSVLFSLCLKEQRFFCRHEGQSCRGQGGSPISYRYFFSITVIFTGSWSWISSSLPYVLAGNLGQQRFQEPLGGVSTEPPLPHTIGSLIWLQTLAISVSLGCLSSEVGVKLFSERLREAVPYLVCAPLLPPYCRKWKGKDYPEESSLTSWLTWGRDTQEMEVHRRHTL